MKIVERNVYVGPSLYAHFPVIRLVLDLGPLEAWPTGRLGAAYIDALIDALPGLHEHGCSYGEPGGFIRRMRGDDTDPEGTWLGPRGGHGGRGQAKRARAGGAVGHTRRQDPR